jgi:hypothetical protein
MVKRKNLKPKTQYLDSNLITIIFFRYFSIKINKKFSQIVFLFTQFLYKSKKKLNISTRKNKAM